MYEPDQGKIAFITDERLYCYKVMPFGLKNTRATFHRLVNHVFKLLIEKTMEFYVDDMITKSTDMNYHVQHLQQTFSLLWKYKMELNPKKWTFSVSLGKFNVVSDFIARQRLQY